jgi:hypothetical protein
MFTSPIDAADEMRNLFKTGWNALTIVTPTPEIRWRGKEKGSLPTTYFARFVIRGAGTDGAGFMENGEGPSPQVFDSFGNVFVQVFAPIDAEDSFRNGELLAIAARDIFLGASTSGGVWFRKARYSEVDDDGKFYCWNVVAEYEFCET